MTAPGTPARPVSRASAYGLLYATVWLPMLLTRGLVAGRGISQLYVDPGVFPQPKLMTNVCARQMTLLNPVNLGTRSLYPSSFGFCAAVRGAIAVGFPVGALARWMAPALLVSASYGMTLFLQHAARDRPRLLLRPTTTVNDAVAVLGGLAYAFNPYTYNEMAASHIYYLVAIAAVPWCASALRRPGGARVVLGGLLLAAAFTQLQFFAVAPVAVVVLLCALGAPVVVALKRVALAQCVAVALQLPWVIPVLLFPPTLSAPDYLVPGSAELFSILPADAVRLMGYPLKLLEIDLDGFVGPWMLTSLVFALVALVLLVRLAIRRPRFGRACIAITAVSVVYCWGARGAPLVGVWQPLLPLPLAGLYRERYSVLFLILLLYVLVFVDLVRTAPPGLRRRFSMLPMAALLMLWAVPFLDGHMGAYGARRETYAFEETVAAWLTPRVDSHTAILSIPTGTVVKRPDWQYYGRNPFGLGGPGSPLDTDSTPSATSKEVNGLVDEIMSSSGCDWLGRARQARIGFAVWWTDLVPGTGTITAGLAARLRSCEFREVFSTPGAEVYQAPYDLYPVIREVPEIVLSTKAIDPLPGSQALQLISPAPGKVALDLARDGGPETFLPYTRSVATEKTADGVRALEPVMVRRSGRLVRRVLASEAVLPRTGPFVFSDATPVLPVPGPGLDRGPASQVIGTSRQIYPGEIQSVDLRPAFGQAAGRVFGGPKDPAVPAPSVVASLDAVSGRLAVSAARDVAGVPFGLPVLPGARYHGTVGVQAVTGPAPRVALVFDGITAATSVAVGTEPQDVVVQAYAPEGLKSAALIVFQDTDLPGGQAGSLIHSAKAIVSKRSGEPVASLHASSLLEPQAGDPPLPDAVESLVPVNVSVPHAGSSAEPAVPEARPFRWVEVGVQPQPEYSLQSTEGSRVVPLRFYGKGVGQYWAVEGAATDLRLTYPPQRVFQRSVWIVWPSALLLLGAAVVLPAVRRRRWALRTRHRLSMPPTP